MSVLGTMRKLNFFLTASLALIICRPIKIDSVTYRLDIYNS